MEKFTPSEVTEAKKFGEFFIDLLENHKDSLICYLANTATLDWFGHTVKGPKNIGSYLKHSAGSYKHHLSAASPARSIGFRDSHVIEFPSETKKGNKKVSQSNNKDTEVTPPQLTFTPPNQTLTDHVEKGQGDGPHNCEIPESPMKKCKLDAGQGDSTVCHPPLKYISTEGSVEFHKKSSKKLQEETKWNRPCKLEVAYSANNFEDCTIYLMIYQGNMKCRRNLLKDFESCEPDN